MKNILLLSAALAASVLGHRHHHHSVDLDVEQTTWPNLIVYKTFKLSSTWYTWNGHQLESFMGQSATMLVDTGRNKIVVNARQENEYFGSLDVSILSDFNTGYQIQSIPFLSQCKRTLDPQLLNKTVEQLILDPLDPAKSEMVYMGVKQAPWDKNHTFFHFQYNSTFNTTTDKYFLTTTGNFMYEARTNRNF